MDSISFRLGHRKVPNSSTRGYKITREPRYRRPVLAMEREAISPMIRGGRVLGAFSILSSSGQICCGSLEAVQGRPAEVPHCAYDCQSTSKRIDGFQNLSLQPLRSSKVVRQPPPNEDVSASFSLLMATENLKLGYGFLGRLPGNADGQRPFGESCGVNGNRA